MVYDSIMMGCAVYTVYCILQLIIFNAIFWYQCGGNNP